MRKKHLVAGWCAVVFLLLGTAWTVVGQQVRIHLTGVPRFGETRHFATLSICGVSLGMSKVNAYRHLKAVNATDVEVNFDSDGCVKFVEGPQLSDEHGVVSNSMDPVFHMVALLQKPFARGHDSSNSDPWINYYRTDAGWLAVSYIEPDVAAREKFTARFALINRVLSVPQGWGRNLIAGELR